MNHPTSVPTPLPALTASRWFAEEIDPHGPALRAYLRSSFPAVRDVDDVVQESFLRVWQARLNQRVESSKSFLFQVARHVAIDLLRRERISPITAVADLAVLPVADERPGVTQQVCLREELEFLIGALDSLPVRLREVMILRRIDGLSQKEIADQLGLSELTVQTHIVRGLRRLEDYFRRHGPDRLSS